MFYIVRCINGTNEIVVTFRGALDSLRMAGPDAAVHSIFGKWIAGRVQGAPL